MLQRDYDKVEGWVITNHVKFNESKCQILHQDSPGYMYRQVENSPIKRDLGVLADGKLNLSQQCALEPEGPTTLWSTSGSALPAGKGRGCPLCCVASPRALGASVGTTI